MNLLPALVAGIGAMYSAGQIMDTNRYWNDYYKNTGYRPRYLYRSGYMDYMKYGSRIGNSYFGYKMYKNSFSNHYHWHYHHRPIYGDQKNFFM